MKDYDLYKYYKGEESNPFKNEYPAALFWSGEQLFEVNRINYDNFFPKVISSLESYILKYGKDNPNYLTDSDIPVEKRALVFFIDLWHGKFFPYDDLDIIYRY